ncbi:DUF2933 domain-containing protein [Streptomyces sp. NPDC002514]|uniref:DUF2933 domain-containing protein n=1 Tax=Streptomyces sp. NPDC001270 TaxID=3364554 RepID=UPI0036B51BF1
MCINKKALFGLGAVAVTVLLFKPGWFTAAAPILILALCPLSMVFMMRGRNGSKRRRQPRSAWGTDGRTQQTGTSTAGRTDLDKQISALQAELRDLKAAQARRDDATVGQAAEVVDLVDLSKGTSPDIRP